MKITARWYACTGAGAATLLSAFTTKDGGLARPPSSAEQLSGGAAKADASRYLGTGLIWRIEKERH
jgi:hypothetical protein